MALKSCNRWMPHTDYNQLKVTGHYDLLKYTATKKIKKKGLTV